MPAKSGTQNSAVLRLEHRLGARQCIKKSKGFRVQRLRFFAFAVAVHQIA